MDVLITRALLSGVYNGTPDFGNSYLRVATLPDLPPALSSGMFLKSYVASLCDL